MQIFEFQFNPQKKGHQVETILYEPKGNFRSLYLVGEMKNIVPGNEKFLSKVMKMIKDSYSLLSTELPEEALKKSLIKVNEYLSLEIAKNNVSWLGNIHLAVISVSNSKVSISKIGNIEIFLIDYGKLKELDGKIKDDKSSSNQDFQPKTFETVVSGKLRNSERILLITKEPMAIFKKEKILEKISELSFLDKNLLENIIDSIKKELLNVSGVFFLLDTKEPAKKSFSSEDEIDFSVKEITSSSKEIFKKFLANKKKVSRPLAQLPEIKMRKEIRRGLKLVFLLIVILTIGFFLFRY